MRRIFKKGLSVFLSLLMVMSSFAMLTPDMFMKAEAATAGKYYVRFSYDVINKDDDNGGEYTGGTSEDDKNGMKVTYTKQDGSTGTYIVSLSGGTSSTGSKTCNTDVQTEGSDSCTAQMDGIPTSIVLHIYGSSTDITEWYLTQVEVSTSSTFSTDTTFTLWSGKAGSHVQTWLGGVALITVNIAGNKVSASGDGTSTTTNTSNKYDGAPSASEVKFLSGATSITIPRTGASNVTNTYTAGVYDQYGVRMSYDPTFYLSATNPTTALSSSATNISGVSLNSSTGVLTTTSSAQISGSTDYKNVYIQAKYGSVYVNRTVTLNDPEYTYTLNANGGALSNTAATTTKQYGNTFGSTPDAVRTGFSLKGFYTTDYEDSYATNNVPTNVTSLASGTIMVSDLEWFAAWQADQHNAAFTYKNSSNVNVTETASVYYSLPVVAPTIPETVTSADGDYTYTFSHWANADNTYGPSDTLPVMGISNVAYTAVYDTEEHFADYSDVDAAISEAEKYTDDAEYEAKYTEASRMALTRALGAVVRGLRYSQQYMVNDYVTAINDAVANLEKNKYVVLFLDDEGAIIKDGYHFVEYGDTVTVPATPEKDYDADKHYIFDKWDQNTSACSYVTDDLVFTAQFTGTNHSYTETTVDSTCTTDGSTLYECTGCDHSYTVANGDTAGHTWETTKRDIIDATCGTAGLKATYCSVCGAIDENSFETYTEESEHDWADEQQLVAESCTGTGIYTKTCNICNKTEYRFVEATGHTWGAKTVVAPTCMSKGYTIQRCTTCWFASYSEQLPAKDSHLISTTTLAPTCATAGYVKETCAYNCGYEKITATPATGAHTIPKEWTVVEEATCSNYGTEKRECSVCHGEDEYRSIEPTGVHSYGDWKTVEAASCGVKGLEKRVCTVCGIASEARQTDALEHNWTENAANTKAATCTETGIDAEICTICNSTREFVASKLGHDYEKTASTEASCEAGPTETWTCKNDATHTYTIITGVPNEHNYGTGTVVTQATCTTPQISLYICADCGDRYELATAVPNGHSYIDNWQVISAATATENGQLVRYCTVCNAAPEYATIPATGAHSFVKGEYVAPDCDTAGSQAWVCTTHDDCEANYEETIPATGHELTLDTKDATCTETGYVKLVCGKCSEEIDSYEIPMLSHTYTEVAGSRQEASCTEPGSYKTACVCGDEQEIIIPATGHTYTTEDIPANCTVGAKTVYSCACGDTYTITTSDPLGHDWGEWEETKEATETIAGELTRECKNSCGAKETAPLAPTGEHNFVKDTEASVEATCDTAGKLVFKCTAEHDCGVAYTYDVPAKGHQLKLDFKQATCTEDGHAIVSCPICQAVVETNTISKLGHKYEAEVTTEAKCGEEGVVTYTCANCGDSYTEKVPALEHSFIVEVAGTKVAPTCITDGKVTMKCFNCDETQEKVLSKTGHAYDNGTIIVKPDCVTAGKIEYTCQYDHTHKFTEVIEPTGSHTLVGEIVEYPATCVRPARNEQYCEACKNWVVVWESDVPASHTWNDWVVEKLPTQTEDGYQYRVCSVCGEIEEMILTAGRMFRVTFYNDNGERLTRPAEYTYGSKVERPEDPIKHETDVHTFEFLGWTYGGYEYENVEAEVAETKAMLDYLGYGFDFSKKPGDEGYDTQEGYVKELALVAVYKKVEKTYKVTYIDGNGAEKIVENVKHSDITTAYNGVPVKNQTEVYTYTFREWQVVCSKDKMTGEYVATATAQFDKHVIPGQEDKVEKEPSVFMNFINAIINFFKNILAKIGIKL